jgi:geranylgeranyl diphosphate synthase type II
MSPAQPGSAGRRDAGPVGDPAPLVDAYLRDWIDGRDLPRNLADALRYAVLGPGKRLRPILAVRSCEAVGGAAERALAAAAAVEMIHAFSLVHDDLPALDDDDLRRGRPTLHCEVGEALALLAGDALLGLAVELVVERLPPDLALPVCREVIGGCNRMIVGQVYDTLPGSHRSGTPRERLLVTHRNKTGALIRAACRAGALCGGADPAQLGSITGFAEAVGLMFQAVDDLLDVTGTTEQLGKTAGKDAEQHKRTFPSVLGVAATREEVERLRGEALAALAPLGARADALRSLCEFLAVRTR